MNTSDAAAHWARVKAIFQDALEREAAGRDAFIAAACADEPSLAADVRSLLAAHDTNATLALPPGIDVSAALTLEGTVIGAYRLTRLIGKGGMGAVYEASRIDDFKHRVAIKVVASAFGHAELVERFRRERQTLATLDHPNIATLLDGGTAPNGLPYFVMEFVEGQPIDKYCDAGRLSIADRLALFRSVCSAVHYAHQALVVHRDIKPDNILVTPAGIPKLLDFGIAKVLAPDAAESLDLTAGRGGPLTPEYASPEQFRSEPVTTATDIYSLGVLLFHLLTRTRPYRLERGTFHELALAACEQEPQAPSRVNADAPRAERRRLAGDLDAIVLRALRKEPSARYATVDQFSDDIRRHLEGLPVIAHRDALAYRARKFILRRKAAVASAAIAVLALVGAVVVTTWQARIAVRERDRATLEAAKAEQISASLQEMLQSADPYIEGKDVTVAQTLDRAAKQVDVTLAGQPEVAAGVRSAIANTYANLGLIEPAEPLLRRTLADRTRVLGPDHREIARTLGDLAGVLLEKGDVAEAEQRYRASIDMYRRLGDGGKDGGLITALNGLGRLENMRGNQDAAEARYREALALARTVPDGDRWIAEGLNNLAVIRQSRADLAGAEQFYREALGIIARLRGDESPEMATALTNLSGVLSSRRNFTEAEPMSARALAMRRTVLGEEHPDTAFAMFNHAELLGQMGRNEESVALAREVVARRGKSLPDGHPMVAAAMLVLGRSLTAAGRPAEGLPYLQEALARRKVMLPPTHWLLASTASTLGGCVLALGRYQEAEALLVPSYERLKADRGDRHERTMDALQRVIALYDAWHKPERAAHYRALMDAAHKPA